MSQIFTYNATHLTRVVSGSMRLTEQANMGAVGTGSLTLDDEAGSQAIVGLKAFSHEEFDCSFPATFRGYVDSRAYRGGPTKTTPARFIDVNFVDVNARLGFKYIRHVGGVSWDRPEETISTRLTALLASPFLSGLVADLGFVTASSIMLDAADLRLMRPADVIADMAERAYFNYFVYNDASGAAGLWFGDSNLSTAYTSTLRISNVAADVDSTVTFAAGADTRLSRDPSRVVSRVGVPFKNGTEHRIRAATETTYAPRDGVVSNSNVKLRAKAAALGDTYLWRHRNEEDEITTTLHAVPAAQVNLLRAGMRVEAKFTDFATEGYGSFSWFRVLERTVSHTTDDDDLYEIELRLSPQEAGETTSCGGPYTGSAAIVQSADLVCNVGNVATLGGATTVNNLLVAIVGTRSTQSNDLPAGWTPFGGIIYFSDAPGHALRAFYKCVTAAETAITIGNGAGSMGTVWELSSANPALATVTYKANQTFADPQIVGTVSGGLHLMGIGVSIEHFTTHDTPGSGWTQDNGSFCSNCDGAPYTHTAHATGTLSAQASVDGDVHGLHQWGGIVVSFP